MCGIVYGQSFTGKPVNNMILDQYDKQKHRGQQGFGVFNGEFMVHAAQEGRILNWLCKPKNNSELLLMHHRFPTSTINVRKAAHPFTTGKVFKSEYVLVHNGTIRNAEELYVEHQEHKIRYQSLLPDLTFNDSEALLWDFARYMEGKQKEMKAYGAIAFVCIKKTKGKLDKLYFGRNTNPLNMKRDKEGISLSSEGEGEPIERDMLYSYNYELKRLTKRPMTLKTWDTSYNSGFKGNYGNSGFGYQAPGRYTTNPAWLSDDDFWEEDVQGGYYDEHGQWKSYTVMRKETPKRGEPGDWISPALRAKFQTFLSGQDKPKLLDTGSTLNQIEDEEYESADKPDDQEVRNKMFEYLTEAHGHFEEAYWAMETDYARYTSGKGFSTVSDLILLEEVMDMILKEPEYKSAQSVSSDWEAIWKK